MAKSKIIKANEKIAKCVEDKFKNIENTVVGNLSLIHILKCKKATL